MPVLPAVHVSEPEVQRALVAGGVLAPLESWLADATKGGKDALVVAEVRSLPVHSTSASWAAFCDTNFLLSCCLRGKVACREHRAGVLPAEAAVCMLTWTSHRAC